jgi:hypothetical protein
MQSLYFHLELAAPVVRYSSSTPRIGDTISLPELGENLGTLKVFDVIWQFGDSPRVDVILHQLGNKNKRRIKRLLSLIVALCR